jgi:hypothetical protein
LDTSVAEPIFAIVYSGFVEVTPGLTFRRGTRIGAPAVHIGLLLESEMPRAVAATASAVPVESVPDAVAAAVARSARIVEARGRENAIRVFEGISRRGGNLNTSHAFTLELRASLPDPVILCRVGVKRSHLVATGELPDAAAGEV